MARSMRFALLMLALLITTACRFVDQQKDLVARIAAFSVLRPVLEMQSTKATLTQSSIRDTDAVAAKRTAKSAAPAVAAIPAPAQPVIHIVNLEKMPALSASAAVKPMIVLHGEAMRVKIEGKVLRTMALAEARAHLASTPCAVEAQLQKERLQARKRLIVVTPGGEFEVPFGTSIGG